MFKLFKSDPAQKLKKQYARKLKEARDAQRSGKIPVYAALIAESEEIAKKIDALGEEKVVAAARRQVSEQTPGDAGSSA